MTDAWHPQEITPATIEKFLQTHGKRGLKTLSLLGRNHDIYEFAASDIGRSLMSDLMIQMEKLLDKIIDGTAKEEETIEYRVTSKFYINLTEKIGRYLALQKKVKG